MRTSRGCRGSDTRPLEARRSPAWPLQSDTGTRLEPEDYTDDQKAQPNRAIYLETLRRMTPEQRLAKAFELTDMSREALRAGLRQRFPDATDEELHAIYLERLARCQGKDFKRAVAAGLAAVDAGNVISL